MTTPQTYTLSEDDADKIEALLVGRRIVRAETGEFPLGGGRWSSAQATGRLTLDDGTQVLVAPNQGGCACSAGDYELTHLASVDNIITAVRLVNDPDGDEFWSTDAPAHVGYQIFVVADATEINVMTVEGSDGNGYYGTGYKLTVIPATATDASLVHRRAAQ